MEKKELMKRYGLFLLGLFVNSFGVSFITKAELGTSPISSIPFTLSLGFVPTLGEFTVVFSLVLIGLQILLLGKKFKKIQLLQIPVSILFGYFIDMTMVLLVGLQPTSYIMKMAALLAGCVILGLGVYLEVAANVVMLPGEAFVKAVTQRFHTEFGISKVCFDASMAVIAGLTSLLLFHELNGVREGTLIAAILVGLIAKRFGKILRPFISQWVPADARGPAAE